MSINKRHSLSPFSILAIFICLGLIGLSLISRLPLKIFPSLRTSTVSISYSWPGASPEAIEHEVTSKLEARFSTVDGLREISSVSTNGFGKILLVFKANADHDALRFEIANLIRQASAVLPPDVSYPILSSGVNDDRARPLMGFAVTSSVDSYQMGRYVEKKLLPVFTSVEGVDAIQLSGTVPYEVEVKFRSADINALRIPIPEIKSAIGVALKTNAIGKGMMRDESTFVLNEVPLTLSYGMVDSMDWEHLPIAKVGNRIVNLKDIAAIDYKPSAPRSFFRINGRNTINIELFAKPDVNTIHLANLVRTKVEKLQETLEAGYALHLTSDETAYLVSDLRKIGFRAVLSLLGMIGLVLAFRGSVRYALLVIVSISSCLLTSVIFYYVMRIEIHLYSLAGITISLGLIMDSCIIMADHIRTTGNRGVIKGILASTLTTIASIGTVLLLDEQTRSILREFATVVVINLCVSFLVAFLLIPALLQKFNVGRPHENHAGKKKKWQRKLLLVYMRYVNWSRRNRVLLVTVLILAFGVPFHLLPKSIDEQQPFAKWYNTTLGRDAFADIKPLLSKMFGGSFRLFTEDVFDDVHYQMPSETILHVRGRMPEGCTVEQMNETVTKLEQFLAQFREVAIFQTSVRSYKDAHISIHFKTEYELTDFPLVLKSKLESKAIDLGGAEWSVYGVGLAFSNAINNGAKGYEILLQGYNYEQLIKYTQILEKTLSKDNRIQQIEIAGSTAWEERSFHEYLLTTSGRHMAASQVSLAQYKLMVENISTREEAGTTYFNGETVKVYLQSDGHEDFNTWELRNNPLHQGERLVKTSQFANIEKRPAVQDIHKVEQQYQLMLMYDFIGPSLLGQRVREEYVKAFSKLLPIGYSIQSHDDGYVIRPTGGPQWKRSEPSQYLLIPLAFVCIFFICAILLESLRQPAAIISVIPISFIGVFLTFYIFNIHFDQGGIAAFLLLAGLGVNAAIYIVNDFNNFRLSGRNNFLSSYIRAFAHKMTPVTITMLCTTIGLMPFLLSAHREFFWFSFASGVIGGIVFVFFAILLFLPAFLSLRNISNQN